MNSFLTKDLAIDLGSSNLRVYRQGEGIVLNEPSVVAIEASTQKIVALGREALPMLGRAPQSIQVVQPLRAGGVEDLKIAHLLLRSLLQRWSGGPLRPRVILTIPPGLSSVVRQALSEVTLQAGARRIVFLEQPVAAALGAGLEIGEPSGHLLVDIGGGVTKAAVLALGGMVVCKTFPLGGESFDLAIQKALRQKYGLLISLSAAEELKKAVGQTDEVEVKGRDLVTGLPQVITVPIAHITQAFGIPMETLVGGIQELLEQTPAQLAADISTQGLVLTGGGGLTSGLAQMIQERTNLPVHLAADPMNGTILGAGEVLEHMASGAQEVLQ